MLRVSEALLSHPENIVTKFKINWRRQKMGSADAHGQRLVVHIFVNLCRRSNYTIIGFLMPLKRAMPKEGINCHFSEMAFQYSSCELFNNHVQYSAIYFI